MTNNLEVYRILREFHTDIKHILSVDMTNEKMNAIEALHSVLYMAESLFCYDEKLTSDNSDYTKCKQALDDICDYMTDPDRIPDEVAKKVFDIAYTAINKKHFA